MGSSGGGGSTPSNTTNQQFIRYADYVEDRHKSFLLSVYDNRVTAIANNPFIGYTDIPVDDAFFGIGNAVSSVTSLFGIFDTYMGDINIQTLYDEIFESTVNSQQVNDLVAAESALMNDDIEETVLPRFQTGMRDINSVMASSFVVGKAVIEDGRDKSLAKFSAELKYKLIPMAHSRWATTLEWNNKIVGLYSELVKFYFTAKTDVDETNYTMAAKNALWPFTVLDFERAALGALQGATNSKESVAGASRTAKVISGALSGAAMGAMVGANFNTAAVTNSAGQVTQAGSSMGSVYGGIGGALLGAASAYYY